MSRYANKIIKLNCGVYNPANDFLQGFLAGDFEYEDYFSNTETWLKKSNAMFLTPGYEKSMGVKREINICNEYKIPCFENINILNDWLNRPIIFAIVGKSGSGKTTMAEYLQNVHDINMINSYTTRPKRFEDEDGHTFISNEEFDDIEESDMIAYTKFGDERYCATKQQIENINTYVVDEKGLLYLQSNFKNNYRIFSIYVQGTQSSIEENRLLRDKENFFLSKDYYDFIFDNTNSLKQLFSDIDKWVEKIKPELEI